MPMLFSPEMAKRILSGTKILTIRPIPVNIVGVTANLLVVGDRMVIEQYWSSALTHCLRSIETTCLHFDDVHLLKLKDLCDGDATKDGFGNLAELKRFWKNKVGSWDENAIVYSHVFRALTTSEKYEVLPILLNEKTKEIEGYSLFGYDYSLEPIFHNRIRLQYCQNSDVETVRNKKVLSLTVRGSSIVQVRQSPATTTDIFE
jgi:hypothetical protein